MRRNISDSDLFESIFSAFWRPYQIDTANISANIKEQQRELSAFASRSWHTERNGKGCTLSISLPGVAKEDIAIQVLPEEGGTGKLSVEVSDRKDRNMLAVSKFSETWKLPRHAGKISASVKDGVLVITIPVERPEKLNSIAIPVA
jgi:HSP20 family molecular chaperone IbpA